VFLLKQKQQAFDQRSFIVFLLSGAEHAKTAASLIKNSQSKKGALHGFA
jgi:hypothetical protein